MDEERLMHKPPFVFNGQLRKDGIQPNWIEMFNLTHANKNGTPVDEAFREIMVNN
ncbi:hypothetical protein AAG906_016816 [Vitis piasezkii]